MEALEEIIRDNRSELQIEDRWFEIDKVQVWFREPIAVSTPRVLAPGGGLLFQR